jgi:ABC-type polar amino acid transport system ATPase subunit
MLVSHELPLRANLSVLENIAIVPQSLRGLDEAAANRVAAELLERLGCTDCAGWRDAELSHEQRFVAKLLRAAAAAPPLIVVERPALLLPDTDYPAFLARSFAALADRVERFDVLDYAWNKALYPPR